MEKRKLNPQAAEIESALALARMTQVGSSQPTSSLSSGHQPIKSTRVCPECDIHLFLANCGIDCFPDSQGAKLLAEQFDEYSMFREGVV